MTKGSGGMKNRNIVLASGSPRRKQLLEMLGLEFEVAKSVNVDECYPASLDAMDVAGYLANLKADAYQPFVDGDDIYITADTVVVLDGKVLGKPSDEADACRMLKALSGKIHHVVTGVCVIDSTHRDSFSCVTEVEFSELDDAEIESYVRDCRPLDKAGAYGIQERIGAIGIKGIRGSFYNVMGLPVHRLYNTLKKFQVRG